MRQHLAARVVLHREPLQRPDLVMPVHHGALVDVSSDGVTGRLSLREVVDLVAPRIGLDATGDFVASQKMLVPRQPSDHGRPVRHPVDSADCPKRLAARQSLADLGG